MGNYYGRLREGSGAAKQLSWLQTVSLSHTQAFPKQL